MRNIVIFAAIVIALVPGCRPGADARSVVIYTSVDQVHSEPILRAFTERSGINVLPVYDVEAAKTVGLTNRLIAERDRPQADVWWNGEFAQTLALEREGVLVPCAGADKYWRPIAGRARVIIVNTDLVAEADFPRTREDLADERWQPGEIGIAYPLFGTTATEAAALYATWGPDDALAYYRRLRDSGARVVDGNSVVRDLVAAGQLKAGLTDTDDARGAVDRGAPVAIVLPDQQGIGTLVIPATVALVAGGPNPNAGRRLVDFLAGAEVERILMDSGFAQVPLHASNPPPEWLNVSDLKTMDASFDAIAEQLPLAQQQLRELFVR